MLKDYYSISNDWLEQNKDTRQTKYTALKKLLNFKYFFRINIYKNNNWNYINS